MDRTMEFLRKNLPRNTALRFRTQQLTARYGTYITYWQRIGRQIEEGTFKRDILRAQKRVRPKDTAAAATAWEIDVEVDALDEASPGHDDTDEDAILGALGARTSAVPAPPATPPSAAPERPSPVPPTAAPTTAKRVGLTAFGSLGKKAPVVARPAASGAAPTSPTPRPAPAEVGAKPPAAGPIASASALVERPPVVAPGAARPVALAPAAPVVPKPAAPAIAAPPTGVVARPPTASPAPVSPPVAAPPAAAPASPAPRPAATFARPAGAPAPVPKPTPAVDGGAMKDLYERYSEARKKNNEGAVRFETLKESVDKMLPKLKEKYGDRRVDFEVVVQNGRVGLKPKVRE
jgi:hypothetical protein